ncbi:alpha/beta hydrolase [Paenibacillus mesophilus]|uniref:dienelactone hydrolase family protein n=1 Tax=Paenibacillus mesophilus TaxID=2582849 RepID=UPI00110E66C6|nr:dienelactone hydrolase family protein [Paenibacillus mesophilus]TMV44916.1 alpha/beta hydrolase [Paenibacillus mesophilus]
MEIDALEPFLAEQRGNRSRLYALLGRLPARNRPIAAKTVMTEDRGSFTLEKLSLDLNGVEPVPAYMLLPKQPKPGRNKPPVIVYHHSHGGFYGVGKEELLRPAPYMQQPGYGEALTERGFAVLAIDSWAFGERSGRSESSIFKEMLWQGRSMLGMMLYDSIRAVDYVASRPDVDAGRIGTVGMSMGSTMAWWLGALDTRIKAVADICCLTDFHALIQDGGLDRHGIYYYIPDLLTHFNASQINALIAPRPHLSVAGIRDPLTPAAGLDKIEQDLNNVYRSVGASDSWKLLRYDTAHEETPEMREEVLKFFDRVL